MQVGIAHEIFFVLLTALVGGLLVRLLKLSPIIGYIIGGIVFGSIFGISGFQIARLAEIGAILLLFSTGVELSLSKLTRVAKVVVVAGLAQIIIMVFVSYLLLLLLGIHGLTALILAFGFSFSSTAVIVKLLSDRGESDSLHGEIMIGWNLVQDLAVIPVMAILPAISVGGEIVWASIGLALLKALFVVVGTLLLGKLIAPYFLHKIAAINSREILILSAITLAIGTALLTSLFGVSPILGAFLAGVVISESQENHAVFSEIRPLRDLFVALFFVTLGFFVTPQFIFSNIFLILTLSLSVIVIKFLLVFILNIIFKYHGKTAMAVGLGLAQVGEFAFIIFTLASTYKIMDSEATSIGISVALLTLMVTPLLYKNYNSIWKTLKNKLLRYPAFNKVVSGGAKGGEASEEPYTNHIIICGYGRVGGWVGKALEAIKIPFVVIEYNHEIAEHLKQRGVDIVYGDPTEAEIIEAAGVRGAKAIVLAIPDEFAQEEIVAYVQNVNPHAKIISRVHKDEDWEKLKILKVDKLVQPEFEAAIGIVRSILSSMGRSKEEINERTKKLRLSHATI